MNLLSSFGAPFSWFMSRNWLISTIQLITWTKTADYQRLWKSKLSNDDVVFISVGLCLHKVDMMHRLYNRSYVEHTRTVFWRTKWWPFVTDSQPHKWFLFNNWVHGPQTQWFLETSAVHCFHKWQSRSVEVCTVHGQFCRHAFVHYPWY